MKIFEQPNVHTTKQRDCRSYTQRCCLGSLVCEAATVGYAAEHCENVNKFCSKRVAEISYFVLYDLLYFQEEQNQKQL